MTHLTPYLHFNGACRAAMTFYQECLGGHLSIENVGESPMAQSMPAEVHGNVLHATLTHQDWVLMASDMMAGPDSVPGNVMTVCLNGGSREETRGYFDRLAVGGTVTHPLVDEFFGMFGDLTDRFGISWMFQAD